MSMDTDIMNTKALILDYAVRHKCWRTFDGKFKALCTETVKLEIDGTALALFAIQRVIHVDCVEKFDVAIAILHRIYSQQRASCGYEVYWQLMVGLRMKVFLYSFNHEPEEMYLQKLKMLLTGESILLPGESKAEILKVKQKLWKLFRTILSFISNPERLDKVFDAAEILSRMELSRYMDLFSSSVLECMPSCDLDLILKGIHQRVMSIKYPVEKKLNDLVRGKRFLTDDELMEFLDGIHDEEKQKQESSTVTNDRGSLAWITDDRSKIAEASLHWDRRDFLEDGCSIISPSVSDDSTEVQLSDLEKDELVFKDNEVVRTPDLGAFLTTYLSLERT